MGAGRHAHPRAVKVLDLISVQFTLAVDQLVQGLADRVAGS